MASQLATHAEPILTREGPEDPLARLVRDEALCARLERLTLDGREPCFFRREAVQAEVLREADATARVNWRQCEEPGAGKTADARREQHGEQVAERAVLASDDEDRDGLDRVQLVVLEKVRAVQAGESRVEVRLAERPHVLCVV